MTVRITHVTADLVATVDRWGQELRAAGAPFLVDRVDVGDTDIQEARRTILIRGWLEDHGRLVIRGSSADVDRDPAVRESHDGWLAIEDRVTAKDLRVEACGTLDIAGDDEVGEQDPVLGLGKLSHLSSFTFDEFSGCR